MDAAKLAKIKTDLEAEKAKLESDLGLFSKADSQISGNYRSEFPEYGNDEDENANEVAEYSDRLSLEHTLEKQLRDVKQALDNIEKGKYGICKHCGKPIEEGRLEARPTSTSCIECKKKLQGDD